MDGWRRRPTRRVWCSTFLRCGPDQLSANVATMARRLHPGWLVAVFAAIVSASAWMPWLTTTVGGGGWANAIGGSHGSLVLPRGFGAGQLIVLLSSTLLVAGAVAGRGLSL